MRSLRLIVRLSGIVLVSLILVPSWQLCRALPGPYRAIQRAWYRTLIAMAGLKVTRGGVAPVEGAVLMVANHASYLDILIFGALFNPRFVSKADVKSWPGIGYLATWAGSVFVDRKRASLNQQADAIAEALRRDERLILFPEGTSSDNQRVLPIKSSLLQTVFGAAAAGQSWPVQPVMIAYIRDLDGAPLTGARAADYAWFGDATLAPHVFDVLRAKGAHVRVEVLPPLDPAAYSTRKALAQAVHGQLSERLHAARGEAVSAPAPVAAAGA